MRAPNPESSPASHVLAAVQSLSVSIFMPCNISMWCERRCMLTKPATDVHDAVARILGGSNDWHLSRHLEGVCVLPGAALHKQARGCYMRFLNDSRGRAALVGLMLVACRGVATVTGLTVLDGKACGGVVQGWASRRGDCGRSSKSTCRAATRRCGGPAPGGAPAWDSPSAASRCAAPFIVDSFALVYLLGEFT